MTSTKKLGHFITKFYNKAVINSELNNLILRGTVKNIKVKYDYLLLSNWKLLTAIVTLSRQRFYQQRFTNLFSLEKNLILNLINAKKKRGQ